MSNYLKKLSTKSSQVSQTTHVSHSFFDVHPPDTTSFWTKGQLTIDGKKINILNGFFFYKKSKKKYGELKPVFISIYKNYLISSKSKEGISKQCKSVDIAKHFLTLEKISSSSGKYGAGISITYNQKQIELFSKTSEDLNVFLYQFKKYFVQSNFEEMYNLDKKLGSGSYADVYRVKDKLTRRDYAAKFFDISSMKNIDRSKQALKNEISLHRLLEHGNICRLHEVYESSTHIILIMEYAKGERLIDYVIENAPLPEKEAMTIIKELLEAVHYLHSHDIIHRDIKLENVLIFKEKSEPERLSVKLVDFGLSVTTDNIEFFKRSGTPGYVAPEILVAETYDTQVDVFSLGVILFTMLSGKSPFVGPDRATVLKLNKKCEYSFKLKYWENKSANARDLVKKMMEASPEKRVTVQEALSHRCFAAFNIGGFQSLKTLPMDLMSKKSLNNSNSHETSRVLTIETGVDKGKTNTERNLPASKAPHRPQKESQYQPNRSNSVKPPGSPVSSSAAVKKQAYTSKKSNLLQIPQSKGMLGSTDEEEKAGELDTPYDRINKSSLRTFYKLNSGFASEDPSGAEIEDDISPSIGNVAENDIPMEYPNIKQKILSLRETDKGLKSPFRMNSRQYEPTSPGGNPSNKLSCDLSWELEEDFNLKMPKQATVFKASMVYVKKSTRMNM